MLAERRGRRTWDGQEVEAVDCRQARTDEEGVGYRQRDNSTGQPERQERFSNPRAGRQAVGDSRMTVAPMIPTEV